MGFLLLEGGAEFGGAMSIADRRGMELAGGREAQIAILPTAAAPDRNHERAGRNGMRWFQSLGATHVDIIAVIDKASSNEANLAERLRSARLIYLLGGFPRYLAEVLLLSQAWEAVLEAYQEGAVIAGSSAGAMVLCEHYYDPHSGEVLPGLNLLPNASVLPHHNGFGKDWAASLAKQLPETTLIGIDEQTGILNEHPGEWTVHGGGRATVYRHGKANIYGPGDTFPYPIH